MTKPVTATCDPPTITPGVLLADPEAMYTEGDELTFSCEHRMKWQSGDYTRTCMDTGELGGVQFTCTSKPVDNSTLTTLKYFYINHGEKRVFSILNHHKCLS